jgi:hypothetical protein
MKLQRKWGHCALALALVATALLPTAVLADDGAFVEGAFTASPMHPSPTSYCANGGVSIEARGIGTISKLGPLFLTVKKCLTFPSGGTVGTYVGTFLMDAANGDTLSGTYTGTQDFGLNDENGFGILQGTLTFTGGTGRFSDVVGTLSFSSVARAVGVIGPSINGIAYYLVRGRLSFRDDQ